MPTDLRTLQLIKLTGWTLDQIDEAPAVRLDWLLEMDRVINEEASGG